MLREDQTVSQIAAASGVHPWPLHKWKRYTMDHLADLFQDQQSAAQLAAEYELKLESLSAELGKTTTPWTWLKKIWPRARSVQDQAALWSVKRSGLYYHPAGKESALRAGALRVWTLGAKAHAWRVILDRSESFVGSVAHSLIIISPE